jgi:hypothetical protein
MNGVQRKFLGNLCFPGLNYNLDMQIDIIVWMFALHSAYISLLMTLLIGLQFLVNISPVNNDGLFPGKPARSNW